MNRERRNILKGAVGAGAALVAESAHAQAAPKVLFEAPRTTIPIAGTSDLFSVRRIYCISSSYAAHAREMGSDRTRVPPILLSNANRCYPVSHNWRSGRSSLPHTQQELPLRSRTRRRSQIGWTQYPDPKGPAICAPSIWPPRRVARNSPWQM